MSAPALSRLPVRQGTPEWLAMRRTGITASDMPIIAGNKEGIFDLWAFKCGLLEEMPVDEATQEMYDLGHALEPVIAERYTIKTGRPVRRVDQMLRHPDIDWAMASLDRVSAVRGERRIVELKYTPYRMWPTDGPEPVPSAVQDQIQWQSFVTGYPVNDAAVLVGGRVDIHELPADPAYQQTLLGLAEWFRGLVLRQEPPPMDGSESTRKALQRLYRPDDALVLRATADVDEVAHELYRAKAEAKAASDRQATLENALRALLGDATYVQGAGYKATWTRNKDGSKTDWRSVAKAYRALLDADDGVHGAGYLPAEQDRFDAIESLHTATTEGPRVLRVTFKEEASSWL